MRLKRPIEIVYIISLTSLIKGVKGINNLVDFWYFLISRNAIAILKLVFILIFILINLLLGLNQRLYFVGIDLIDFLVGAL